MSTGFVVRASSLKPGPLYAVLKPLSGRLEGIRGDAWRTGQLLRAWLPERSTRTVELLLTDDGVQVRVLALSCPEDLQLAVVLATALASADPEATLETRGVRMTRDKFVRQHGDAWRQRMQQADFDELVQLVGTDRTIALTGPIRDCWFGPRVVAEVLAMPESDRFEAIFAMVRRIQYPPEGTVAPAAMPVDGPDGLPVLRLAQLVQGAPNLMPPAELVGMLLDRMVYARPDDLVAALGSLGAQGEHWDEQHRYVPALDKEQWASLGVWLEEHQALIGDPVAWALRNRPQGATPVTGTLVPMLRPPDWLHRHTLRCRPIATGARGLPLVSQALDQGTRLVSLPWEGLSEATADPEACAIAAVAALAERDPQWVEMPDAHSGVGTDGLAARDEHAAAMILCEAHMRDAQARLGAIQILVAAPYREALLVQDAWREPVMARTTRFMVRADELHRRARADEHPFLATSRVFLVDDGRIVGVMGPQGVTELGPPPPFAPPVPSPAGPPEAPVSPTPPAVPSPAADPRVGWPLVALLLLVLGIAVALVMS